MIKFIMVVVTLITIWVVDPNRKPIGYTSNNWRPWRIK